MPPDLDGVAAAGNGPGAAPARRRRRKRHGGFQHRPVRRQIEALSEAQGHRCPYCGCRLALDDDPADRPDRATRDHVVPRSRGGGNGWVNLVAACATCNGRKGDGDAMAFLELVTPAAAVPDRPAA